MATAQPRPSVQMVRPGQFAARVEPIICPHIQVEHKHDAAPAGQQLCSAFPAAPATQLPASVPLSVVGLRGSSEPQPPPPSRESPQGAQAPATGSLSLFQEPFFLQRLFKKKCE